MRARAIAQLSKDVRAMKKMGAMVLLSLALVDACDKPHDTGSVALPVPPAPATSAAEPSTTTPDVTFTLSDGFRLSLASLRGKVVAVVMCSSIDSVGCSSESRGLASRWRELEEHYVTAIGVVPAAAARDPRGLERHDLPFDFAVDTDGQIARALGVPAGGVAEPTVFVVGRDGSIKAIWRVADPETHARALIAEARVR
jgi:peroxiredoxin Q/BCP